VTAHDDDNHEAQWPELPPPTAGTAPSIESDPAFRLSAAWPYVGAVLGGIILVLVLGLVFVAKPMATSAKASAPKAETADDSTGKKKKKNGAKGGFLTSLPPAKAELSRAQTAVLILNGSGKRGAATTTASELEARNYRIAGATNASHPDYQQTLVLYRTGFRGEAERVARDLGLTRKRVAPVDGMKRAKLGEARVVVILGA
jgi:hypothetical protein